jgi:hypothetical protein
MPPSRWDDGDPLEGMTHQEATEFFESSLGVTRHLFTPTRYGQLDYRCAQARRSLVAVRAWAQRPSKELPEWGEQYLDESQRWKYNGDVFRASVARDMTKEGTGRLAELIKSERLQVLGNEVLIGSFLLWYK